VQYFRVKWLWGLIILLMLGSVGIIAWLALTEKQEANEGWIAVAIVIPLEIVIAYFTYITRLEAVVSSEGIFYKWWPFQRSYYFIDVNEIKETELRNGPPLSYGFHWVPGYGWVHNVGRGKGISFRLKTGKRIFLGTAKPSAFSEAVEKMLPARRRL
jgi:hypothetical protein